MAKKSKMGRIIWAADPLEDQKTRTQGLQVLKDLAERTGAVVEPVYVLSDGLLSLSVPKVQLVKQFKPSSEKALKVLSKEGRIAGIASPTVLVAAPSSRSGAVEALDNYARKRNADLILVNSHGRSGVRRAFMGSFAETLTLHSKTPVLISGPNTKHVSKLDSILFPTDFTRESKKAFEKVQDLAKKLGATVTLFNVVLNPIEPIIQSGTALIGGGFVSTLGYVDQNYEAQKKTASSWALEAKKNGVKVNVEFDVDSASVIFSVLEYARKSKPGLIAMASESGAISAALLGSVGREIARAAPCPVWFLRA